MVTLDSLIQRWFWHAIQWAAEHIQICVFWKGCQVWIVQSKVIKDFRVLSTHQGSTNSKWLTPAFSASLRTIPAYHPQLKKALRVMKEHTEELEVTFKVTQDSPFI